MDALERAVGRSDLAHAVQYDQVEECLRVLQSDSKNKKAKKISKALAVLLEDEKVSKKLKNVISECLEIVEPEMAAQYLLTVEGTATVAKRLYTLREVLPSEADRLIAQPLYLETAAGRKLLAWLLGQEEREAREVVRAQLATGSSRRGDKLAKAYGECFFLALKNYQDVIVDALQTWVRVALYSENDALAQRAFLLFRSAVPDRRGEQRAFVDAASYASLAPLLWRSLTCANSKIRARAVALLGTAFPVFSHDVDAAVEEQIHLLSTIITDDQMPSVRAAACKALGRASRGFGPIISQTELYQIAKNTLAATAARDSTHFSVREAAILALGDILPHLHNYTPILDTLAPCVHDVHPKCRAACIKALAQVKLSGQQLIPRVLSMYRSSQSSSTKSAKKLATAGAAVLLSTEDSLGQRVRRALVLAKADLAATRVLYARHAISIFGGRDSAKLAVGLTAAAAAAAQGTLRKSKAKRKRDRGQETESPDEAKLLIAIAAELCDGPAVDQSLRDYVSENLDIAPLKNALAGDADLGRLARIVNDTSHDFETSDARSIVLACQRDPITWVPKLMKALRDPKNDALPAPVAVIALSAVITHRQADWFTQAKAALTELRQRALSENLTFAVDLPALVEAECKALLVSSRTDIDLAQTLSEVSTSLLSAVKANYQHTHRKRPRHTDQASNMKAEDREALLILSIETVLAAFLSAETMGPHCRAAATSARVNCIDTLTSLLENDQNDDEEHPLLELAPHILKLARGQPQALALAIALEDHAATQAFLDGAPPLDAHDELLDDLATAFDSATLLMDDAEKRTHFQELILPLCTRNQLPVSAVRHTFLNEGYHDDDDDDENNMKLEVPHMVLSALPPPGAARAFSSPKKTTRSSSSLGQQNISPTL